MERQNSGGARRARERSPESRTERRLPQAAIPIRVRTNGQDWHPAWVLDISRSGLRINLKTELPVGAEVEMAVKDKEKIARGEIRYCSLNPDGTWSVGIQTAEVFENLITPEE